MKGKDPIRIFVSISVLLFCFCAVSGPPVMHHQVTGPIQTNCYLLYDTGSKEAALIDVGGPIDSLIAVIDENDLELKYIFATHCHMDHIIGVLDVKKLFPDALIGFNKAEYEDLFEFTDWMEENSDPADLAAMKQDPEISKWFDLDPAVFGKPDVYLEDDQTYKLGKNRIRTFLTPGHSVGGICFHVGDMLFSGDVLFYRQVGRTDILNGSNEAMIESVRRLYRELPEETKVFPGHGPFTDIGTEKEENEEVNQHSVNL